MSTRKEIRSLRTNSIDEIARFAAKTIRHQELDCDEEFEREKGDPRFECTARAIGCGSSISLEDAQKFAIETGETKGNAILRVNLKTFARPVGRKDDLAVEVPEAAKVEAKQANFRRMKLISKESRVQEKSAFESATSAVRQTAKEDSERQLKGKLAFYSTLTNLAALKE